MSEVDSTTPFSADKSSKPDPGLQPVTTAGQKIPRPYPDFPLGPHPAGYWCKRIKGTLRYFGPHWNPKDPTAAAAAAAAALKEYDEQKDDLQAGKTPRPDREALTVKELATHYLYERQKDVDAGTLAIRTWRDYRAIMEMLVYGLGKSKPVATLGPQDFSDLKKKLAKRSGAARMCTVVQVIRSAFKFADDSDMLDRPIRFGPAFKRTAKKTLRIDRARQGPKLFTADEIRNLIEAAGTQVKAMLLLGINCGYGNNDCGTLRVSSIDFERGVIDFPRPKTGIARRCVLWPETVAALKEAIAHRPKPNDPENADLLFVTKFGQPWSKDTNSGPLVHEMRKLLRSLGINGRHRLGFYTLRHTFRTIADEAKDQPAADFIMGHESPHMSSHYRETISDERLRAVTDHVRAWLVPPATNDGPERV